MIDLNSLKCRSESIILLLFVVFTLPLTAKAQLPFYTDDADTTDKGKFHFEFFNEHDILQKSLYPAKRQNTANFTLNYGVTSRLELDINAVSYTHLTLPTIYSV